MATFFGVGDAYSHNLAASDTRRRRSSSTLPSSSRPGPSSTPPALGESSPEDVLLAQVREFEPDVVYVQDVHYLTDELLAKLKQESRLLVCQLATEPPSLDRLRVFDLVVTCLPSFVTRFRAAGIRTELLRLAFDERVLHAVGAGQTISRSGCGLRRLARPNTASAVERAPGQGRAPGADRLLGLRRPPLAPVVAGEAEIPRTGVGTGHVQSPRRRADRDQPSREHRRTVRSEHAPVRGDRYGCVAPHRQRGAVGDVFDPGSEAVSYDSARELVDRLTYYIRNEKERAEIAAAGHARTLRDHTYGQRMRELVAILEAVGA